MRRVVFAQLALLVTAACGSDSAPSPDAPTGNHPPPRVIAGGGIGDGAIDGVVNVYVIDDVTRMPISGANVQVGDVSGTTDATGLFVAEGVKGPQTIAFKASGYRSELWIGANGANMTVDLHPAVDPALTKANVSGSITNFSALAVPTGHRKMAVVSYSNDDRASDAENNIMTGSALNICDVAVPAGACTFTVTTRTGHVALIAQIYDHDTKGDTNPANDTFTLIAWAYRTGLTVEDGKDLTAQDLTLVPVGDMNTVTVDFGSPPAGLPTVAAVPGIDVGADGVIQLAFVQPSFASVLVPKASVFSGGSYRLTAIATNGTDRNTAAQSFVLRRNQTGTTLSAGTWLAPPSGLSLTRSGGSWQADAGALIQGAEYDQGTTHLLSVTVLDGSTSFTIPDLLALPSSGTLIARGTALAADIDLMDFELDRDFNKLTAAANQPVTIN